MRLILIFRVFIVIAVGALFGVLNRGPILLDLYFGQIDLPLGVAVLMTLIGGWLLGGVVHALSEVPRLRCDPRAATVRLGALERASSPSRHGVDG